MVGDRRIKRLEGKLTSKQQALLWLTKAQATAGWIEYGRLMLESPPNHAFVARDEEASFLYLLAVNCNAEVLADCDSTRDEAFLHWLYLREIGRQHLQGADRQDSRRFAALLQRYVDRALLLDVVMHRISETEFEGHAVLFSDAAANLAQRLAWAEQLAEEFSELAAMVSLEPLAIPERRIAVGLFMDQEVARRLTLARAEALHVSECRRAAAMLLPLVSD